MKTIITAFILWAGILVFASLTANGQTVEIRPSDTIVSTYMPSYDDGKTYLFTDYPETTSRVSISVIDPNEPFSAYTIMPETSTLSVNYVDSSGMGMFEIEESEGSILYGSENLVVRLENGCIQYIYGDSIFESNDPIMYSVFTEMLTNQKIAISRSMEHNAQRHNEQVTLQRMTLKMLKECNQEQKEILGELKNSVKKYNKLVKLYNQK